MLVEKYNIGCKINLFLHIVGRRENGYHELESVFLPIKNPADTIIIENLSDESGLVLKCNRKDFDLENNTLTKAYNLFKEKTSFAPSLNIYLEKNIPQGAGLGGGSADAGFLLLYLYAHYKKLEFTDNFAPHAEDVLFLNEIAVEVGADVPFFLENKPSFVEGIGEKISQIDVSFLKNHYLLLISPKIHAETEKIFKAFKEENPIIRKKIKKNVKEILTSINKQAIKPNDATINALFRNDLEQCVFSSFPALGNYKEKLIAFEAVIALMSGSGSSLFGIFQNSEQAEKAKAYFDCLEDVKAFDIVEL